MDFKMQPSLRASIISFLRKVSNKGFPVVIYKIKELSLSAYVKKKCNLWRNIVVERVCTYKKKCLAT